jgi:hypothetical protein
MRSHHTSNGQQHNGQPANGKVPKAALAVLLATFDGAQQVRRPAREDALVWNALHDLGLTQADLDALLLGGLCERLEETTGERDKQRAFREAAGDEPGPRSRVVLTPRGARHVRQLLAITEAQPGVALLEALAWVGEWPFWDGRDLYWQGAVVKSLRDDGANQRAVLNALEAVGWREPVANPLRARPGRSGKKMLYETIESLNDRQTPPSIRFYAVDGGVFWKPVHVSTPA